MYGCMFVKIKVWLIAVICSLRSYKEINGGCTHSSAVFSPFQPRTFHGFLPDRHSRPQNFRGQPQRKTEQVKRYGLWFVKENYVEVIRAKLWFFIHVYIIVTANLQRLAHRKRFRARPINTLKSRELTLITRVSQPLGTLRAFLRSNF